MYLGAEWDNSKAVGSEGSPILPITPLRAAGITPENYFRQAPSENQSILPLLVDFFQHLLT